MAGTSSILRRTIATLAVLLAALLAPLATTVAAAPARQGKSETVNGALTGHWANDFGQLGANGVVNALLAANGKVYAGGAFTEIAGSTVNYVSIWNGHGWLSLGGMNNHVYALAVVGEQLYAAGKFTFAGGVAANYIARWDGASWQPLGSGTDDAVYTIVASGSDLYASGTFTHAGGVAANYIARWDGSAWHPLGDGLGHFADDLLVKDGSLYAAGGLVSAGGLAVTGIARWDGAAWHDVGGGIAGAALALADYQGDLYAGGYISGAGGNPANNLVRWDGSSWHDVPGAIDGVINDLVVAGNDLYVGGGFNHLGSVETGGLGRWDGSAWHAIGEHGLPDQAVQTLAVAPDGLYFGGYIIVANGAYNIGRWDGSSFHLPQAGGPTNSVSSLAVAGATVYAAGYFSDAGYGNAFGLAAFDGASWSAPAPNISSPPSLVAASDSTLYAYGLFSMIGSTPVNHIASWDGANWSALGSGITDTVAAMVVISDDLVVGGQFTEAGGVPVQNVARWDGSSWSPLGSIDGAVNALTVWNGELYAAVHIFTPSSSLRVLHWTGSAWVALPGEMDNALLALAAGPNGLYAGGSFTHVGAVAAKNVARWNGSSWSALGDGLASSIGVGVSSVNALAVAGDKVFVGGFFDRAGGAPASNIAVWDGSVWDNMEGGVSGYAPSRVDALAYANGDLYVGGIFAFAGRSVSHYFAVWHDQPQFSDVSIGDYWYGPVRYLTTRGALSGYSTSPPCATAPCFNPFANTTRGQATKIIVNALGIPPATPVTPTFSDVPAANPFFAAVEGAVAAGVVSGYDSSAFCAPAAPPCFRPNSDVTRGQLAKIVVNAAGWKLITPASATFADVAVGSTFYSAIETAVAHGIISGYSTTSGREFRPANSAIRAQLAKIVYQATR